MSMCSIPACLLVTLNSLFTHTCTHTHTPHVEVRGPLVVPLLIISFNLRKQTQAVMSISYHAAAIVAHTPLCLPLQIQGEDRRDRMAEKTRKRETAMTRERRNQLKTTFIVEIL